MKNMEKVYDLRRHTHYITIHIDESNIFMRMFSNINKSFRLELCPISEKFCITYSKQTNEVLYWGNDSFEREENELVKRFDISLGKLHQFFKKDWNTWNPEDTFFIKAVSDFIKLGVVKMIEDSDIKNLSFDQLHYAFVAPSEWEEEIGDRWIRPVFILAGLLFENDHNDRLLFVSDLESIWYNYFAEDFKRGQSAIMIRFIDKEENITLLKMDLIKTSNSLFEFPNSSLYPKVMRSISFYVTSEHIKSCIRDLLIEKLSIGGAYQESILQQIADEIYTDCDGDQNFVMDTDNNGNDDNENGDKEGNDEDANKDENANADEYRSKKLMRRSFTVPREWNLNDSQITLVNSISIYDICSVYSKTFIEKVKDLVSSISANDYKILKIGDRYSHDLEQNEILLGWIGNIWSCNRLGLSLTAYYYPFQKIDYLNFIQGVARTMSEAIQYSDMYCPPRIIHTENIDTSFSVFSNSKPDVIINIDISLDSTLLLYSFLSDDGSTEKIYDHDYFTADKCLSSLNYFYNISDVVTLKIKEVFISFTDNYLLDDFNSFSINQEFLSKAEDMLNYNYSTEEKLTCTQDPKYIKAFLLMYLAYTKHLISKKLPTSTKSKNVTIKTGYAITIEKTVLDKIIGTKQDLQDLIYASSLVKKDDEFTKLRILTQGEGILSMIQNIPGLDFPVKSYFVLAQLREDYIQLTLNQVVTASSAEDKQQEAIIVEDRIIYIQNIYESLCLNMWNNLIEDNSLIQMCHSHSKNCNNNEVSEMFSLESKNLFMSSLKEYILNNIMDSDSSLESIRERTINLNQSCDCKVCLSANDITNICFKPLLEDINTIIMSSLTNKDLFGNYTNIDYFFNLINFNNNSQFQKIIARILNEEAEYYNPGHGIETVCVVLQELPSQFLQPIPNLQPFFYKGFIKGTLHHVYSRNFGFYIAGYTTDLGKDIIYKKKRTDRNSITINQNISFPLLKNDSVLSNAEVKHSFYLCSSTTLQRQIGIVISQYESGNTLQDGDITILEKHDFGKEISQVFRFNCPGHKREGLPLIITVTSLGYSSSVLLSIKEVGKSKNEEQLHEISKPMTLSRS